MQDVAWLVAGALRMLAWTLIHSVWLGAVAALAVACALHWIPPTRPRVRYRLTSCALAVLVIGTVVVGHGLEADWAEHVGCWERVEHAGAAPLVLPQRCRGHVGSIAARLGAVWIPDRSVISGPGGGGGTDRAIKKDLAEAGGFLHLDRAERDATRPAVTASGPLGGLAVLWAVVAAALLARFLGGVVLLRRRVRDAAPLLDTETGRRLRALGRVMGVRRHVAVSEAPGLDSPVLAGWRRPTVLLPTRQAGTLSGEELTAILAHELVHVRRADYAVNLVQRALEALFFFNPAVLWISRRVRTEREAACDRDVIHSGTTGARSYVAGLVAAEFRRTHRGAPVAALSHAGEDLLDRARRLAVYGEGVGDAGRRTTRPGRTAAAVAALVSLALLCLPVAYGATNVSSYGVMTVDGRARRAALAARSDPPSPHAFSPRPSLDGARSAPSHTR
jgi:beta-lactamase regulating signal transducer with metallopeptidase domain